MSYIQDSLAEFWLIYKIASLSALPNFRTLLPPYRETSSSGTVILVSPRFVAHLPSTWVELLILDISHEWNHTI